MDDKDIGRVKAIVMSMTPEERQNPDIISQSRRRRIARGCGQTLAEVNQMIKQFNQSRDMMSQMSNGKTGGMKKMMRQMQQMGGGGGMPGMPGMPAMNDRDFMTPEQIQAENEQKKLQRMLKKKKKKR